MQIRINHIGDSRKDQTNGNNQSIIGEERIDTVEAEAINVSARMMNMIHKGVGFITSIRLVSDATATSAEVLVRNDTEICGTMMTESEIATKRTRTASEDTDITETKTGYIKAETIDLSAASTQVTNEIEVMMQGDTTRSF